MDEKNPYQPPQADLGTARDPDRYRPMITIVRVLVGLWGLFILAGPSRDGGNAAYHGGQVAGKAVGAILFMVAVFPIRRPRPKKPESREIAPEDL